ncbi:MAG: TonB-dependent receptor [Acidobacteria bacterium]|nr:TonB-dependent receptor [Acidobacteriota bacterium]
MSRLLALVPLLAVAALAQSSTATLQGLISDSSGAAVPGAEVAITNSATNITRRFTTSDSGLYSFPLLPPGTYRVEVIKSGFKPATRDNVLLQVSDRVSLDLKLEIGAATERVTVDATAPLVNTTNATLGQVIENRRIIELPLNGREPFSLAALSPGVLPTPSAGFVHLGGSVPSINGASNFTSEVTVDGMPNTTPRNGARNNFLIYTPSVDAVSEFKVETNALSAEFGRFNGGVISVVTKSGTNRLHGTVYEFLRNSKMDANSFFANRGGVPIGALRRNQFGFTLGGPLVLPKLYKGRDRTFFFIDYEGFRESQLATSNFTVPTVLERAGDFSRTTTSAAALIVVYDPATLREVSAGNFTRSPFPGNVVPSGRISNTSRALAQYFPAPTNTRLVGNLDIGASRKNVTDSGDIRLDHNLSDRHKLFGRYSVQYPFVGEPNYFGNIGNSSNPPLTQRRHSFTLQDTYTFSPTLILNVNYGISRMFGTRTAWSDGFDVTTIGIAANFRDAQQVRAIPPTTISSMSGIGNGNQNYSTQLSHSVQASLTKIAGKHTLKGGADFRTFFINQLQNTRASGNLNFAQNFTQGPNPFQATATGGYGYATFLLGIPSGVIATDPAIASKSSYWAFYLQEDYKMTRKLTVNAGIRYDLNFARTERYDRASIFDFNAASPIAGRVPGFPNLKGAMTFSAVNGAGRPLYRVDKNNFAPRIGLAYQLNDRTTVRAGYGIFFGLSPTDASGPGGGFVDGFTGVTNINTSLDGITPIVNVSNPFPGGTNPPLTGSQLTPGVQLGQAQRSAIIGLVTPYFQNWNFSIQRSVGKDLIVEATYAANKGNKTQFGAINLNDLTAAQIALGAVNNQLVENPFFGVIIDPTSTLSQRTVQRGQLLRPYPQYTQVTAVNATIGNSMYHSFQLRVERRFAKGFTVLGAFTAAKNINDTGQDGSGPTAGILDHTNLRLERSLDPQDVSKRLVLSGMYELPFGRGKLLGHNLPRFAGLLIGNWQINGIGSFQSGFPLVTGSIGGVRPNRIATGTELSGPAQDRLNRWFDTSAFAVPPAFTYGNSSRTTPDFRTQGTANYDLSLFKNFQIRESIRAQFRFESFNAFNRVQFAAPNTTAGATAFGQITAQQNTPRQLQVALKLIF